MIKSMDREYLLGLLVMYIKDSIKMMREKATVR
jgi:hypothetical protein